MSTLVLSPLILNTCLTTRPPYGLDTVAAIACYPCVTGAGETKKITGFVRHGEVNAKELVLPDGLSAADIAKIYSDLALRGVIVRN